MKSVLVGYKEFKSKKGVDCHVAIINTEFSPAENSRGSYGCDSQQVFLDEEIAKKITPDCIGKQVEMTYSITNGRAYLQDMNVIGK